MQLSIIVLAAVGAVYALPGSTPVITAAPELKDASSEVHHSSSCTSTDCWASYAECNGSLTFVYLCYTPPPCGTATSPDPYSCPPPKPTATSSVSSTPSAKATTTTFTTSTASGASAAPTVPVTRGI
ncbi:hypothetical protein F5Y01DRAFT_274167 [Xylaria sp. FL0043]|nr:hypothetical protein F5Y01DRAFT_274167 [Xylaria sp. FL0043]